MMTRGFPLCVLALLGIVATGITPAATAAATGPLAELPACDGVLQTPVSIEGDAPGLETDVASRKCQPLVKSFFRSDLRRSDGEGPEKFQEK